MVPAAEEPFDVEEALAESAAPKPGASPDGEFDWDGLNLGDRAEIEDTTRPPPLPPRPKRIQPLDDDDHEGTFVKPRARDESVVVTTRRPAQPRSRSQTPVSIAPIAAGSWRDHAYWVFALALLPLAISMFIQTDAAQDEIIEILSEHPDVQTKEMLFQLLPDGKLKSAHLRHDSLLHWVYALGAAVLFSGLLAILFPDGKATMLGLVIAGVVTGTIGIALLLAFQLIAASTRGVMPRGRGLAIIIFLIVKFIGFSYDCASNPQNGFLLSFMGFTCAVGLCEELCKALPIVVYLNTAKETNWQGACLIGLASGIGFGISEGIMYSGDSYNGIAPLLMYFVRFLSCVSLHAIWSGSVALLMERNQDYIDPNWEWEDIAYFVICYLGIAMILHGLYDTLLKQDYQFFALVIAAISFGWWVWLIRRARLEHA